MKYKNRKKQIARQTERKLKRKNLKADRTRTAISVRKAKAETVANEEAVAGQALMQYSSMVSTGLGR
jgi:hypothetical protein